MNVIICNFSGKKAQEIEKAKQLSTKQVGAQNPDIL